MEPGMLDAPPHVRESLPAYALGSLSEAEARTVRDHLAGCKTCQTELRVFQVVTAQLALTAPDDTAPSPELKGQLMQRIRTIPSSSVSRPEARPWLGWLRPQPVWRIVMGLLILALGVGNLLLWQRINTPDVLTAPQGMRAITLRSTEAAPQASGFLIIGADGQNGVLVVDALPQLDPALEYQLWLIRDEESTSGAIFAVDETGYRGVRILAPESLLVYSAALVTIEPAEGSPYPTGTSVMDGRLPNP